MVKLDAVSRRANIAAYRGLNADLIKSGGGGLAPHHMEFLENLEAEEEREGWAAKHEHALASARRDELVQALGLHNSRQVAMKKLDLLPRAFSNRWLEMMAGCAEVQAIKSRVAARAGVSPAELCVFAFSWIMPSATLLGLASGSLFIVRFNGKSGPYDYELLDFEALPVRALLFPQQTVDHWRP